MNIHDLSEDWPTHRPIIKNWSFDGVGLRGQVYDYPGKPDGRWIATSNLIQVCREEDGTAVAHCHSRMYVLGYVDPGYEAKFPNALDRLIKVSEERMN